MSDYGGAHHLQINGFTGLDVFLGWLPRGLRLRLVARKILRHHGIQEVTPGAFTFTLPGETAAYEIVDSEGNVRPWVPR